MTGDFIIIGGGASGLACAIKLKRINPNTSVTIIEKLTTPGKKILATGNGRCNLSNTDITIENYNGDKELASLVLSQFGTDECLAFFKSIGLMTSSEERRIYPLSRSASSVRDLLAMECKNLGVNIITDTKVISIEKKEDMFEIYTESGVYTSKVCVMALGGKAATQHGTDGDGYRMLKSLGIRYEQIYPALVRIKTDADTVRALRGVRVLGTVTVDGLGSESGEIQFTDGGVSGIAVMQFSGQIAKRVANGEKPVLHFDLCPNLSHDEILNLLAEQKAHKPSAKAEEILIGIMNEKLAKVIAEGSNNDVDIADKVKDFTLVANGTDSYKDAQVTHGGVGRDSLMPRSLQSLNVPGLFICGELLNVDGMCGGYNLHFAWGSGILAAKEAAEFASNK